MRIFLLLLLSAFLNQASSGPSNQTKVSFYLASFSPESCNNGSLICSGVVTAYNGYLSLTSEPLTGYSTSPPAAPLDKVGRVLYHSLCQPGRHPLAPPSPLGYLSLEIHLVLEMGWHLFLRPLAVPHHLAAIYGSNLGMVSSHLLVNIYQTLILISSKVSYVAPNA